jgi:MFS family permease
VSADGAAHAGRAPRLLRLPSGGLWRHGDFLRLWAGQSVSQAGSQISLLAFPLTAILVFHRGPFALAVLNTVVFLPFVLVTLPAGVIVDRLPRRGILVACDLLRAAVLASLPVAYAVGVLTLWHLFVAAFLTGCLTVFFDVAYQAYLPSLVEREQLADGNTKLALGTSTASLVGPGAGGAVINALSAPVAIVLDAVSFVVSALFLTRIRTRERVAREDRGRQPLLGGMRQDVAEGLRFLVADPYVRAITATIAIANFFSAVFLAVQLVYFVRVLGLDAASIGALSSVAGVGAIGGSLVAGRACERLGVGRTLVLAALLDGPAFLLVPLAPAAAPFPFLVVGAALGALGTVAFNVAAVSLQQAIVPPGLLGRVTASRRLIVWGIIPFGSLSGGALGTFAGLRAALFVGAVGALLGALPVVLSPSRTLRDPTVEPASEVAG